MLQQKYPEYFNDSVNFISVLHDRNDIEPILHFFKILFDKVPKIILLNTSGISENKKIEFKEMFQNKVQSLAKSPNCESIEADYFLDMPKGYRLSKYLYNASGNIFYDYNQLILKKITKNMISTGTCTPFSRKIFITADGKILPCERIDYDFAVGYIHDDRVELDYKYVAEQHNYYLSKFENQCISCAVNKYCNQCIYQIDDIRDRSSVCLDFHKKEAAEKEREQIFDSLRQHPHYYEKILNETSFTF